MNRMTSSMTATVITNTDKCSFVSSTHITAFKPFSNILRYFIYVFLSWYYFIVEEAEAKRTCPLSDKSVLEPENLPPETVLLMKYMRCEKGRWHINEGHTANSQVDLDPIVGFVSLPQPTPSPSLSAPPCTLPTLASPHRANCWSLSLLSPFRLLYLWTCSFLISYRANLTHSSRLH